MTIKEQKFGRKFVFCCRYLTFAPLKIFKAMAFTRYKRKDRKNKTVSRQRKQLIKKHTQLINVESPNKDRVVIVED